MQSTPINTNAVMIRQPYFNLPQEFVLYNALSGDGSNNLAHFEAGSIGWATLSALSAFAINVSSAGNGLNRNLYLITSPTSTIYLSANSVQASGDVYAVKYHGDGSLLTGISGGSVGALSAQVNATTTFLTAYSGNWQNTYTTVCAYSASWGTGGGGGSNVSGISGNWQNTYTTVSANSANWNTAYTLATGLTSLSSNWQNTYTTVQTNSGIWSTGGGSGTSSPYSNGTGCSSIQPVSGTNRSSGTYSVVGGGCGNNALSGFDAISSGTCNYACGMNSFIGGGGDNVTKGLASNVAGGFANQALSAYSNVAGGWANTASGYGSHVGGGIGNVVSGNSSSINGGYNNTASGCYSTITGGCFNALTGSYVSILGGTSHLILSAIGTTIVGGYNHTLSAGSNYSVIAGGRTNSASACYGAILGGHFNVACSIYGSIGGGEYNTTAGCFSTVMAGRCNSALSAYSTVIGGCCNFANNCVTTVAGGRLNNVIGFGGFIGGGSYNTSTGSHAVIAGGCCNTATGNNTFIAGGCNNDTKGKINTFILGSNLSATATDYTYVNNLTSQGLINGLTLDTGLVQAPSGPLKLRAASDSLGAVNLQIANITGINGLIVTNESLGLSEIAVKANTAQQMNFRMEGRSAYIQAGNAQELQIIDNTSSGVQIATFGQNVATIGNANTNMHVGIGKSPSTSYSVDAAGSINASAFYGDGSHLTGINSGLTFISATSSIQPNFNSSTTSSACYSNVLGGFKNTLNTTACFSHIGGGACHTNSAYCSFIGGGCKNTLNVSASGSVIVGGGSNTSSGGYNFIGGGRNNQTTCYASVIVGGNKNCTFGAGAIIVGGCSNCNDGTDSFIAGGCYNSASGFKNVFILGTTLSASVADYTYVQNLSAPGKICAGFLYGNGSTITGLQGVASGQTYKYGNTLVGTIIPISGANVATAGCFTNIGGGCNNINSGCFSTIDNGRYNTNSGFYSFIAGGSGNNNSFTNTFLLGSNLSASQNNYTYTNNLSVQGTASIGTPTLASTLNNSILTVIGAASGSTFNQIQNTYASVSASTDLSFYNDSGTTYLDIGINSTKYNGSLYGPTFNIVGPGDSYLYPTSGNLAIGTANNGTGDLVLFTGGTTTSSERMRVTNSGNVGIGTSTPNTNLTVAGSISATGQVTAVGNSYIATGPNTLLTGGLKNVFATVNPILLPSNYYLYEGYVYFNTAITLTFAYALSANGTFTQIDTNHYLDNSATGSVDYGIDQVTSSNILTYTGATNLLTLAASPYRLKVEALIQNGTATTIAFCLSSNKSSGSITMQRRAWRLTQFGQNGLF